MIKMVMWLRLRYAAVAFALFAAARPASAERRVSDLRPAAPPKPACTRVVAATASFQDVHVVGVVAQGRLRKILVLVAGKGSVVLPGECVGRERVPFEQIFERVLPPDNRKPVPQQPPPGIA